MAVRRKWGQVRPDDAGNPVARGADQQEVAPKVAMDRAQIVSLGDSLQTPAGRFEKCLKTEETSVLESGKAYKLYAPEIGLICDGNLKLTKNGRAERSGSRPLKAAKPIAAKRFGPPNVRDYG